MSTPLKFPRPASLIMLAAGLAAGWLAGRLSDGDGVARKSAVAEATNTKGGASGTGKAATPDGRAGAGKRSVSPAESQQFEDSIRTIFRETVEERRMEMFERMLERAGPEHYAAVVALIRENDLRGCGSAGEWSRLWASWGRRDPAGAMEFIRAHDWSGWSREAPEEAKNRTLIYWGETDPEGARHFLENSPELANGDRTGIHGMVRGWASVDAPAAAEWLFKSGLGMSAEYKAVVEAISRKGGQEALDEWFAGIKQAGAPEKDLQGFAEVIARNKRAYQPEKAAAWVEQHLAEPWVGESEIVGSTARSFAERDPAAAMEWAQRTGLESANQAAMATWCQRDLDGAGKWLRENPGSPGYSQAASVLVFYLQQKDPAAAQTLAEGIPDESIRTRVLWKLQGN